MDVQAVNTNNRIIKFLKKPFKLECLHAFLLEKNIKILDVGCGNHSPSIFKSYYPLCKYYGLDRQRDYNLDDSDFECMEGFFQIDLAKNEGWSSVPDNFFDCVIMSHVIEHISNGEDVLSQLILKLKSGGIFYIEFPSEQSTRLPTLKPPFFKGTLNFYDDPTHVRIYNPALLQNFLKSKGCRILQSKTRRSLKQILLFPLFVAGSLGFFRCIISGILWDITGFAHFILVRKD